VVVFGSAGGGRVLLDLYVNKDSALSVQRTPLQHLKSCDLDGIQANMQGLSDFPFGQAEEIESEINHGEP
jgi:hypothetical protein